MTKDSLRFDAILKRIPHNAEYVLDIGCARHSANRRSEGNLHQILHRSLPRETKVMGVDVLEDEVELMADGGYSVQVADMQRLERDLEMNVSFDAIVAGDVIEHVPNPGLALQSAAKCLSESGRIILTTPNPDGFVFLRKALSGATNNETHTCWIDPANLERLLEVGETGLKLSSLEYLPPNAGVSELLWRLGKFRAASPGYVAVLEPKGATLA